MDNLDSMGRSILWYCHRAVDPILENDGNHSSNQSIILELSQIAIEADRNPVKIAQKMAVLGYNREHRTDVDIPSKSLEDSNWGIEPLVIAIGLAHYQGWWDLVPYTEILFSDFTQLYDIESIVEEFRAADHEFLNYNRPEIRIPYWDEEEY